MGRKVKLPTALDIRQHGYDELGIELLARANDDASPALDGPCVVALFEYKGGGAAALWTLDLPLAARAAAAVADLSPDVAEEAIASGRLTEQLQQRVYELFQALQTLLNPKRVIRVALRTIKASRSGLPSGLRPLIVAAQEAVTHDVEVEGYGTGRMSLIVPNTIRARTNTNGSPQTSLPSMRAVTPNSGQPVVLLVDEDASMRSFLRNRLKGGGIACLDAAGGEEALDILQQRTIDLVITELRTPDLDAPGLLAEMGKAKLDIPVIVVAGGGPSFKDAMEVVNRGAVGLFKKPFQFGELSRRVATVLRSGKRGLMGSVDAERSTSDGAEEEVAKQTGTETKGSAFVEEIRAALASGKLHLPVSPAVLRDLRKVMNDKKHEAKDLVSIVERDQDLTMRVLRRARSAAAARRQRVASVTDALTHLGEAAIYSLAIESVKERFIAGLDNAKLAKYSSSLGERAVATAEAARRIAAALKERDPEEFYALALLCDVGEPLLIRVLDRLVKRRKGQVSIDQVRADVARLHGEFGRALLAKWEFDGDVCAISQIHHNRDAYVEAWSRNILLAKKLAVVNLARHAVDRLGHWVQDLGDTSCASEADCAQRLKLGSATYDAVVKDLAKEFADRADSDVLAAA